MEKNLDKLTQDNLKFIGKLFNKHYDKLFRSLYFRCRNRDLAEDVVTQSFIKAIDKFDQYKGNSDAQFYVWIYSIAQNTLKDEFKKNSKFTYYNDDLILESTENIEEFVERKDKVKDIQEALKLLEIDQRKAVEYKYFEEMSLGEISEVMGRSKDAVRMLIQRGEKNIKNILSPDKKLMSAKKLMSIGIINSYIMDFTKHTAINLSANYTSMTTPLIITKLASLGIAKLTAIAVTTAIVGTATTVGAIQVVNNVNKNKVETNISTSNTKENSTVTPTITITTTISPTTTQQKDYTGWSEFTDPVYQIKFHYPAGWTISSRDTFTLTCDQYSIFWKDSSQCTTFKNHAIYILTPGSTAIADFIIQLATPETMLQTASCNSTIPQIVCEVTTDTVTVNNISYSVQKATSQEYTTSSGAIFPFSINAVTKTNIPTGTTSQFKNVNISFSAGKENDYQQMLGIIESIQSL